MLACQAMVPDEMALDLKRRAEWFVACEYRAKAMRERGWPMIYALALIGAITVAVLAFRALRQFWKDLRSKGGPWLGLPWGPG